MPPHERLSVSVAEHSDPTIAADLVRDPENVITPHQLELLALYASGLSRDDIGAVKFLSPFTVRNNLTLALRRSGARNLTHLCAILIARGALVSEGDGFRPVQDLRIV